MKNFQKAKLEKFGFEKIDDGAKAERYLSKIFFSSFKKRL